MTLTLLKGRNTTNDQQQQQQQQLPCLMSIFKECSDMNELHFFLVSFKSSSTHESIIYINFDKHVVDLELLQGNAQWRNLPEIVLISCHHANMLINI